MSSRTLGPLLPSTRHNWKDPILMITNQKNLEAACGDPFHGSFQDRRRSSNLSNYQRIKKRERIEKQKSSRCVRLAVTWNDTLRQSLKW